MRTKCEKCEREFDYENVERVRISGKYVEICEHCQKNSQKIHWCEYPLEKPELGKKYFVTDGNKIEIATYDFGLIHGASYPDYEVWGDRFLSYDILNENITFFAEICLPKKDNIKSK